MSCKDVADWLHRDATSLDEAQRLVLDDHLATCAQCRGDRVRMQLVRGLGQSLEVPAAGARDYNRAIAKALLEGKRTEVKDERPKRRMKWIVPVIAFAGVAAAATVVAKRSHDPDPAPALPASPAPSPAEHAQPADPPQPTAPPPPSEQAPSPEQPVAPREHHAPATHRISAAELLERARTEFAAKQFDDAEKTANLALAARPTHALKAEIHMLLAEIAQGAGKTDVAVARYNAVADTFRGTAAAESALYAAARVELKRRHPADARVLLDRYLDRYPTGRYADDARRELSALH